MTIRRFGFGTLAALVAASVFLFWVTPPAPARLDAIGWTDLSARTISGAYHIHSTRSDGHGDRAQIAAAASRAGLQFIILTDHGDGTRPPDPASYIDGVLVLDGVELSTDDGHYVAIDMPRAPYPLGGSGEAVVEDVRRLGGLGIAAHPDSPKEALRWTSTALPDGVEWINLDSEWRDETRERLVKAGAAYLFRPGPALTMILNRPATLDARWPALLAIRPTLALAAADAHGGVGRRAEDASRNLAGSIGIPSYEASFRVFTNRVILERPLSGDAQADARAVYAALRGGRVFSTVSARAAPALLDFWFEAGFERQGMGAIIGEDSDGTLIARGVVPPGSEMSIVRNGRVMTASRGGEVRYVVTGGKGAYRVEVQSPGAFGLPPVPWLVSNPIYFGAASRSAADTGADRTRVAQDATPIPPFPWRVEKDSSSSGLLKATERDVTLEYKLGPGERASQFVALASDITQQVFGSIELTLNGDRPLRASVQVRTVDGKRWGRSYYVDPAGSQLHVRIGDLRPIAPNTSAAANPARVSSLLLVIDLTNAEPGRAGTLRVSASALHQ